MELQKIAVYHPNGKDKIFINKEEYSTYPGKYKLFIDKAAPAVSETSTAPAADSHGSHKDGSAATPETMRADLLALDPDLATEEGILALADKGSCDNKKATAVADILGIAYTPNSPRDELRAANFEAVSKLFKA